jgi:hypothetical protein
MFQKCDQYPVKTSLPEKREDDRLSKQKGVELRNNENSNCTKRTHRLRAEEDGIVRAIY